MTRARFLSMMAAAGATILGVAPSTVDTGYDGGTVYVGPGTWWIQASPDGSLSATLNFGPDLCTIGYVVVE